MPAAAPSNQDESNIPITPALQDWLIANKYASAGTIYADAVLARATHRALMDGALDKDALLQLCGLDGIADKMQGTQPSATKSSGGDPSGKAGQLFSNVRVKSPSEQYSSKRPSAVHAKTGRAVYDESGAEVSRPSQKSLAISGAFLKASARRAGLSVEWGEHDQQLFDEAVNQHEWASYSGPADQEKRYAPGGIKAALLDDSNSGGLEAAPILFDADFITTPLLTGELLPEVNLVPISRGRRIEGGSISTPTAQWNQADATEGTVFDSTGQIAALDSTVYDLSCHVLVGRNFLSDTPLAIGNMLVALIGERMGSEIERVIAVGSGSEPSGVMGASGTTAVNFSSAAATVAKYLELLFAVPKQLRVGANFCFAGNETTYRRARSIATGVTGDTRLVFEMNVENYSIFGRPFKIAPSMTNSQIFAGNMGKYRLYRRLGSQVEWSMQGDNLQRRNEALLTVRQRWAGRVMLPSAFGVVSDAQA